MCRLSDSYVSSNWDNLYSSRLVQTKSSVVKALAQDFDTPQAISAVMNLVYHGNCQLHSVSKVTQYTQ